MTARTGPRPGYRRGGAVVDRVRASVTDEWRTAGEIAEAAFPGSRSRRGQVNRVCCDLAERGELESRRVEARNRGYDFIKQYRRAQA